MRRSWWAPSQRARKLRALVAAARARSAKGLETSEWEGLTRAHGGLAITIFILVALHLILATCR